MSNEYRDTILADNPIWYSRLDDPALSTVMPDISASGPHNGAYFSDAGFGMLSPILTDGTSRAISGRVGQFTASDSSYLGIQNASSMEGWMYWPLSSLADTVTLWSRATQWGVTGGYSSVSWNPGGSGLIRERWYYVLATRNGGVLRLYVNGVLRAQSTGNPTGAFHKFSLGINGGDVAAVYSTGGSGDANWLVGVSGSANVWYGAGVDEAALYDYDLNSTQARLHYEAALNIKPLHATVRVFLSIELDTDQAPVLDLPFSHNYADPIDGGVVELVETITYQTNVNQSQPDYQQRINALPYGPERALDLVLTPNRGNAKELLQAAVWEPGLTYRVPIDTDLTLVTATANPGDFDIYCDTTGREFEVGSYAYTRSDVLTPSTWVSHKIVNVFSDHITVQGALETTVALGDEILPARQAVISKDSIDATSYLAQHESMKIEFNLLDSELGTNRQTTYTPTQTYKSLDVFDLEVSKVEWLQEQPAAYTIARRVSDTQTPGGNDYQYALDTGSPQTLPMRLVLASRAERSNFLGWLDRRQGKQHPFWVPSRENEFVITGSGSGTLTFRSINYTERYRRHRARRYLAYIYTNETMSFGKITAAVDNGDGTETISIDAGPSGTLREVCFLKLYTAPDRYELRYTPTGDSDDFICEVAMVFQELLTTPD